MSETPPPNWTPPPGWTPPKQGMSTGKKLALGCGIPLLLGLLLLGGCAALVGTGVDNAQTTTPGAPAVAGGAGGRQVVTLAEFDQVKEGMTRPEVEAVFGAKVMSNSSTDLGGGFGKIDTITYQGDGAGDFVMIQYDKDNKLTSKSQSGLG